MTAPLNRYLELTDTLRAARPRPDRQTAAFAAATLVHAAGEIPALVDAVQSRHAALRAALGAFRAPEGSMRWIYAAILTAHGVDISDFLGARQALRDARRGSRTGSLHSGGARAALVLSHGDASPAVIDAFYAMKRALLPPWWRSSVGITDTFAAAHVLAGSQPEAVVIAREKARTIFATDPWARGFQRDGARQAALLGTAPEMMLQQFRQLETARREDRYLRGRSDRSLAMGWAASGRVVGDIEQITGIMRELPRGTPADGHARARLATLIGFDDAGKDPTRSATAMVAVLAAQAAMAAAAASAAVVASGAATS